MLIPLLSAFQLAAAAQPAVYNGRLNQTAVALPKIEATVVVDGRLDEAAWSSAAILDGFSLYQPADGRPAPDSTQVRVWYSSDAIHFGIRAFAEPGTVAATLADRDRIGSDDNIELHLDTFHERNRAFVFIVNPLGIQADGTKSEGGGFIPGSNVGPGQNDLSADFVWDSRGRLTPWGFEVEVRIPFESLRYPSKSVQTWGLQIDRHVQRNGYEETWTPARRASASFIAQSGTLEGLTGMRHGQVAELNPEFTNTTRGTACCAPALDQWSYSSHPQLGGNARWAMGSNFVLNGTVKPDFSQVEADATQVAADERFALFYPEKRPFFVEALDQFNVPNQLVYTRTIVQPDAAVKLTGKLARADVALLSSRDQGRFADIVRLRQGIGEQSQAGLVYSDRVGQGRTNRIVGADTKLVFGRIYFASLQAVQSFTSENGASTSGPMWEAVVDATNRGWGFHYNVLGIHPDFRTDNGFVPRTGYVKPNAANRFTWYGQPGAFAERFNLFLNANGIWRYDDFFHARSLLEDVASAQMQLTLRGGWSVGMTPRVGSYAFDPASYASYGAGFTPSDRIGAATSTFSIATPQFRKFNASASTNVGNDVDFLETSRVRRVDYSASLDLRPSERLRVNATYASTSFRRRSDGQRSAFARIPRFRMEYQLARPLFVRVVSQYTATRREALLDPRTGTVIVVGPAPSTATSSNVLRTDWLVSYRPAPGTVFFAGYGGSMSEQDPLAFQRLRRTGDAFFVKGSYVFRLSGL
ncbi:MAG TPA: carbohydrate binding family 9 domain-containing protein [Gemmatimonadaceae bacterium]|nr:carbohydrate binding family 9 domain-containing protein [Gemmatimonadaceae bacterium]